MKVSKNWLSEYVDLSGFKTAEEIADCLTHRGLEIDAIEDQAAGFEKVVSAKVLTKQKHPNADRLNLCQVDNGSGENLAIVCGAQNFEAGDIVCLAQVGAKLPNGLVIKKGKIRGETSEGMLCSEEELGLASEAEGILVLPAETKVGLPLAKVLNRSDVIFEVAITPNRGDCLSHIGIAREIAAASGQKLKLPKNATVEFKKSKVKTALKASDRAKQFYGIEIEGVEVKPSPQWLKTRIESMGAKSINNIVDASNFVMFECGQPLHAYDADLLDGSELSVRKAKKGEKLTLLDETNVTLNQGELVISDEKKAVALAGVMGGGNSEVRDSTKKLFLECAEFDASEVRRAASRHKIHSDASHRFEREIDTGNLPWAISRLANVILEVAGGAITGGVATYSPDRSPKKSTTHRKLKVSPEYLNEFLGMSLTNSEIKKALSSIGFEIDSSQKNWNVSVPSYRNDIRIKEDLADELAKTVGYDQLPSTIPVITEAPHSKQPLDSLRNFSILDQAKEAFKEAGFQECIHYGFASRDSHEKLGIKPAVNVMNPMSEDQEIMVSSLVPNLIQSLQRNMNHHFGSEALGVRLFEIRPTFHLIDSETQAKASSQTETGVMEKWECAFLSTGMQYSSALKNQNQEAGFFEFKGAIENFLKRLGTKGVRISVPKTSASYLHPGVSAGLLLGKNEVGQFGLLHPAISQKLKLRQPVFIGTIRWQELVKMSQAHFESQKFKTWSEFPSIERDFALLVKNETPADRLTQLALSAGRPLAKDAKIFDIYEGQQVAEGMTSIAVRVIFSEEGRSLKEEEAEASAQKILSRWKSDLGAELRG